MEDRERIIKQKYRENVCITKNEKRLWRLLSSLNILFNKQHLFDYENSFIMVDILLPQTKQIIEVDGKHHYKGQKLLDDAKRDMFLTGLGFKVIRVTNEQVKDMTEKQLSKILHGYCPCCLKE